MNKVYAWIRENPLTVIVTLIGVLLAGGLFLRGESTRDEIAKIDKRVIRIEKREPAKQVKGVAVSNGNHNSPSGQPSPPRGGHGNTGGGTTQPGNSGTTTTEQQSPAPAPIPPAKPPVNVPVPQLPILGQPQVCVPPLVGVNC